MAAFSEKVEPYNVCVCVFTLKSLEKNVEPCPPELGWVVFDGGTRPMGHTMQISSKFLSLLLQRKTQIYAAEAIVPLILCSSG